MKDISLEALLEAGCHFGHQVNRRNPKADDFIFEARSNINIIDLEKTHDSLLEAARFIQKLGKENKSIVIVGTKRQAKAIVKEEAERARAEGAKNVYYITTRWIGGMLTNYGEVSKNFKRLKELTKFLESGNRKGYTKKEILLFEREKGKLESLYAGVADLKGAPDAVFIIDTHHESTAIAEAKKVDAATIGIVDTNADPMSVTFPIPANDDAVSSIKIITSFLIDAYLDGVKIGNKKEEERKAAEEKAAKAEEKKEEKQKEEKAPKKEAKVASK